MTDVKVPFFLFFPFALPCLEAFLDEGFDGEDFDAFFVEVLRGAEEFPSASIGRESVGSTPAAVNVADPAAVTVAKPSTLLTSILREEPLGMIPSLPFVDE